MSNPFENLNPQSFGQMMTFLQQFAQSQSGNPSGSGATSQQATNLGPPIANHQVTPTIPGSSTPNSSQFGMGGLSSTPLVQQPGGLPPLTAPYQPLQLQSPSSGYPGASALIPLQGFTAGLGQSSTQAVNQQRLAHAALSIPRPPALRPRARQPQLTPTHEALGRRRTRGPARAAPSIPGPSTPRNLAETCRDANGLIRLAIGVYPPTVSTTVYSLDKSYFNTTIDSSLPKTPSGSIATDVKKSTLGLQTTACCLTLRWKTRQP
jgi:hypothetical protein